jgi:hypothetical protein
MEYRVTRFKDGRLKYFSNRKEAEKFLGMSQGEIRPIAKGAD